MRRLFPKTRIALVLSVLLGLGALVIAPAPAMARPVQVSPVVRYPAMTSGQVITSATVHGSGSHPLSWFSPTPFLSCRNDWASIIGFQGNGAFVDGIAENEAVTCTCE